MNGQAHHKRGRLVLVCPYIAPAYRRQLDQSELPQQLQMVKGVEKNDKDSKQVV